MVVNLLLDIEIVSVLKQGWSILKDTNSAALVLIPRLRPGFISQLQTHH